MKAQSKTLKHFHLEQGEGLTGDIKIPPVDEFLSFVGWEERSVEISKLSIDVDHATIYRFSGTQSNSKKEQNSKYIRSWLVDLNVEFNLISGPESTDTRGNFNKLEAFILSRRQKIGRPFSLCVDISTCPKSYISFLIAFGFSTQIITCLYFYYAHTDYKSKSSKVGNGAEVVFDLTEGEWEAVQIPYLEGEYKPSNPRKLVVFIGAEGSATESFLKCYQPDKTTIIVPSPSVNADVGYHIKANTEVLKRHLRVPNTEIHKVRPFDMIEAIETALDILKDSQRDDVSLISLGTKPHCISAAIACMVSNEATLVCRTPKKYRHSAGVAVGRSSLFSITDLSNPVSLFLKKGAN